MSPPTQPADISLLRQVRSWLDRVQSCSRDGDIVKASVPVPGDFKLSPQKNLIPWRDMARLKTVAQSRH